MATKQRKSSANSNKRKPSSSSGRPASSSSGRTLSSKIGTSSSSRSKSGKAESKVSRPTMSSTGNQSDELANRMAMVRSDWERVAGMVALASLFDVLENLTTDLDSTDQLVADVRARGYRFGRDWETQLRTLRSRWPQQRSQALRLLESERRVLQSAARDVEMLLQRASRDAGLISTAESRVNDLQFNVSRAEARVRETFDGVEEQTAVLRQEVEGALALLDALDTASFNLLPDEHAVAMCNCTWTSDAQEPEGRLFLTDSRLIFEQYQKVATKKILFITTEKELVQEKLWESPIGGVEELEIEDKKAFLSRKEMLTLRFNERTRELPNDIVLQLKDADNETWHSLIRRVKSGQMDSERFGAPAPQEQLAAQVEAEVTEPEKELPTVCPNCNAPLPAIFKGMKQVNCDYCGTTVNL